MACKFSVAGPHTYYKQLYSLSAASIVVWCRVHWMRPSEERSGKMRRSRMDRELRSSAVYVCVTVLASMLLGLMNWTRMRKATYRSCAVNYMC